MRKQKQPWLRPVTLIAFCLAAVISVWKLVVEGARPMTVIPAICFVIAAILWLWVILRSRGDATADRKEDSAPG